MHFDLILLTNSKITNPLLSNFNYKLLDENHFLVNDYTLDNGISFDYIIVEKIEALKNIDILKDENSVICNYYYQTNIEHIFFVGKENNSKKEITEQINQILEYLSN